jgi:hypothetical protein
MHRHGAPIQAATALAGTVLGSATLIYLVRYANDTRSLLQLIQKQFEQVQMEDRDRRQLQYIQLSNEDRQSMPHLRLNAYPDGEGFKLTLTNDGKGPAEEYVFLKYASIEALFSDVNLAVGTSVSVWIPRNRITSGDQYRLIYLSEQLSGADEEFTVDNQLRFVRSSFTLARQFDFLIADQKRRVDASGSGSSTVLFGNGPPPGAKPAK